MNNCFKKAPAWLLNLAVVFYFSLACHSLEAGAGSHSLAEEEDSSKDKGALIDLDFTNADIHNVVRFISDVSGVNIVVAGDVKAKVTIRLNNVPWDIALNVILKEHNLLMIHEGDVVRVIKPESELKEKKRRLEMRGK